MAMSKADFVVLAEQLRFELRRYEPGSNERKVAVSVIREVARGCSRRNNNFQRDAFYAACEVTPEDLV